MRQSLFMRTSNPSIQYADRIFGIAMLFLLFSFLAFILIDFFNFLDIQNRLIQKLDIPYFWYHWFLIPLEVPLQWYILGAALGFFMLIAGTFHERRERNAYAFWLIIGIGVILMFVEDAGDVRHAFRHYVEKLSGETTYGFMGSTFELFYFAVIAGIITYALVRYREVWLKEKITKKYFTIAYIFYGLSVGFSFLGAAYSSVMGFSLYDLSGNYFMELLFINDEESRLIYEHAKTFARIDFCLMDMLVEESLEFVGAAALLAAGAGYWHQNKRNQP